MLWYSRSKEDFRDLLIKKYNMYVECKACWKEFWIPKSREWIVKYCSKECRMPSLAWKKFWRLTALWNQKYKNWVWYEECLCECWNTAWIQRRHVLHGTVFSCWCYRKETARERWKKNITHNCTHTRLYHIYKSMFERCKYAWSQAYDDYWWRGIRCLWESFESFRRDMQDSYNEHVAKYWVKETTIDRIDVNWDYCKENCRWATYKEQMNNKRTNIMVSYKWETMSVSDLCRKYQVPYDRTKDRIKKWWSVEDAVELPEVPQWLHKKWIDFIIKYLRECQQN